MPWTQPALPDLRARIKTDLENGITLGFKSLRNSVINVLATAWAGASYLMHSHIAWAARQLLPTSLQDLDFTLIWASIFGTGQIAAINAQLQVTLTLTSAETISIGTVFLRSDGFRFLLDATLTGAPGSNSVSMTAETAGALWNTDNSTVLTLETPDSNVTNSVVSATLTVGADVEQQPSVLARLLNRIQQPPQGGNSNDFVTWAQSISGVGKAWCYPANTGPGTVGVAFITNVPGSLIPGSPLITAVQNYINSVCNVVAEVTVFAPTPDTLNFTINGLTPSNAATKAAIQTELQAFMLANASPGGTLYLSQIREAISIATGVQNYSLTAPSADVVSSTGHYPIFGTITWT